MKKEVLEKLLLHLLDKQEKGNYDYETKKFRAIIRNGKVYFDNIRKSRRYKKVIECTIKYKKYVLVIILNDALGSCVSFIPFIKHLSLKYPKVVVFTPKRYQYLYEDYAKVFCMPASTSSIRLNSRSPPIRYYDLSPRIGPDIEVNKKILKPVFKLDKKSRFAITYNKRQPKRVMFDVLKQLFVLEKKDITKVQFYNKKAYQKERKKQILICLGSRAHERDLTVETYIKIINYLLNYDVRIILIGNTKKEIELSKKIKINKVENKVGKTNLKQLMNLIGKSMFVIGPDTGTMHLADYLNTNTLTLFGPTDPSVYAHQLKDSIDLRFKNIKKTNMEKIYKALDKLIKRLKSEDRNVLDVKKRHFKY